MCNIHIWDNLYVRKVAGPVKRWALVKLVALPCQKEQTKNNRPIKERGKKEERKGRKLN